MGALAHDGQPQARLCPQRVQVELGIHLFQGRRGRPARLEIHQLVTTVGMSQQVNLTHQDVPLQPKRKAGLCLGYPRQGFTMVHDVVLQLPDGGPLRRAILDRIGLRRRQPGRRDDLCDFLRRENLAGPSPLVNVQQRPVDVGSKIHRVRVRHLQPIDHREPVAPWALQEIGQLRETDALAWAGWSDRVALNLGHARPAEVGRRVQVLTQHLDEKGAGTAATFVHHVGRPQDQQLAGTRGGDVEQLALVYQVRVLDFRLAAGAQCVGHLVMVASPGGGQPSLHHRADDDHREFQPLGLVNGHHPHGVLGLDDSRVHPSLAQQVEIVQEWVEGARPGVFVEGSDEPAEHAQETEFVIRNS